MVLSAAALVQACTSREAVGVIVRSVEVQPASANPVEGGSQQFTAIVLDDRDNRLTSATVDWLSEDTTIVRISADGMATAVREGSTRVRATFQGQSGFAEVTVSPVPKIQVTPDSLFFSGGVDDSSPPAQAVLVENGGGARLADLTADATYEPGQPTGWLGLSLSGTVATATLTVTPDVAGLPAGDYDATIDIASPDDPQSPKSVPVRLSLRGITIVETGGSTVVSESGTVDQFTVALGMQPNSEVVLTISSGDSGEVIASENSLTFTPGNWNQPQTVTVTGQNDPAADGDQVTQVSVAVDAANSDDAFDVIAARVVSVTTIDDDAAGFALADTASLVVTEEGTTDQFSVVLTAQPVDSVVFTLLSSDPGEAVLAPGRLTFRPSNWDQPQTVTVTGVNDGLLVDGPQTSVLTVAVDTSASDPAFDPLPAKTASVTTSDDDRAGFALADTAGLIVNESGTADSFTVMLTAQPVGSVVLTITSGDSLEVTVAPIQVQFTSADWDQPKIITVTGVDDEVIDGPQTTDVVVAVGPGGTPGAFALLGSQVVRVTTNDNDSAGFVVTPSTGLLTTEAGDQAQFTVRLASEPTADVTLELASSNPNEGMVSVPSLTFTPAAGAAPWNAPQTVVVTGVDDFVDDGDVAYTVTTAAVSADADYDGLPVVDVSLTNADDDAAALSINDVTVIEGDAGTVNAVFTVTKSLQSSQPVSVDYATADGTATEPGSADVRAR